MKVRLLIFAIVLSILGAAAWGTIRFLRVSTVASASSTTIPTTTVKRGPVLITVSARGELQGGNSEMLVAPMTGVDTMPITFLRQAGELVQSGDVVVQFDSTQQEYNLREAESDYAEAEQQVIQADATAKATEEESRYQVLSTESDVKLAELEVRRNPILATITARQNDLALEAAQNKYRQAQQDLKNKLTNAQAAIAIQQAALNKAKVTVDTNKTVIASMILKAKSSGYVNIQANTFTQRMYWGMTMLPFQLGDIVRPGMAVAQIPDLKTWEVSANVGELDRGHLSVGQQVSVAVVALPGKSFPGHVKSIGGTSGSPWDRHFETRIALDAPAPDLRPGMTSNMVITVEKLDNVTWVPAQALFESDGRTFVYLKGHDGGFLPHDVSLVRRSESQAVIKGIAEGALVAMSNPDQQVKPAAEKSNAMKALPR
jgi:multidrug efflux pump subunit AcrA (membrane-fusion protein)